MEKILRKIKYRLRSCNPKRIFCNHRYNMSWGEGSKYWSYTYYICEKCGRSMAIQTYRWIEEQRD